MRAPASLALALLSVFVWCEYVIYYPVILRCAWPRLQPEGARPPVRALVLADTHLLGALRGHWLDKLRREWQMERAFQTALWLLNPEVVFILGDVFDEGKWSSSQNWDDDVRRFQRIFRHPTNIQLVVLIGNHDIGFHHEMTEQKLERFERAFNVTSAQILTVRGVNFVLVNSVALHGDGCSVCRRVETDLRRLSRALNCSTQRDAQCSSTEGIAPSAPVLLQHFPLYRASDALCSGVDAAPPEQRHQRFDERYDVLSKSASKQLLWWFKPRLILSGHTHSGCEVLHENLHPEISVPSFSWRNRNNPSFFLGVFSMSDFRLSKCFLPEETSVLMLYCCSGLLVALMLLVYLKAFRRSLHAINSLLRKRKAF